MLTPEKKTRRRDSAPVVDLNALPDLACLTTKQLAVLTGFAEITLKTWRGQETGRGPRVTYIEGRPRYLVRNVKNWLMGSGR